MKQLKLNNSLKKIIKIIITIFIIVFVIHEGKSIFNDINFNEVRKILINIPYTDLIMFFTIAVVSILSISLYDLILIKDFKYNINIKKILVISWISSTFNNLMGLGGLIGAAFRTLLFKEEKIDTKELINYNVILITSTMVGLSALTYLGLINIINFDILLKNYNWLWPIIIGFSLFLPLYLFVDKIPIIKNKFNKTYKTGFILKLKLISSSLIEWILASILFFVIAKYFRNSINYTDILGIFLLSAIAGIISFIPGGIGSFDLLAVIGLKDIGLNPNDALTIMLLFRIFYYIIPWIIGSILAIVKLADKFSNKIEFKNINRTYFKNMKIPQKYHYIGDIIKFILFLMMIFTGTLFVIIAFFSPASMQININIAGFNVPEGFITSKVLLAIGILYILISFDIKNGVRYAYKFSIIVLSLTAIGELFTHFDLYKNSISILIIVLLYLSRNSFNRKSYYYKKINMIIISIIVSSILFVYQLKEKQLWLNISKLYKDSLDIIVHPQLLISENIIIFILFCSIIVFYLIKRPKFKLPNKPSEDEFKEVNEFLLKNKGNNMTHLIFLGDKNIYWNEKKTVLISYSKIDDKIVALGDPIGTRKDFKDCIMEMQNYFDQYGLNVYFYEISQEYLSIYHDCGYHFFKLGEEGTIDLTQFTLSSNMKRNYNKINKNFEAEGYKLEFLYPPYSKETLDELFIISNEWLGKRKEKGFSLGYFNESYIERTPIYVLKDSENKIVAFMNLRPYYDEKTVSVDLMRFKKNSPKGTMDAMFLGLIKWSQENDYKYFGIGMAPLSNVGLSHFAHSNEKLVKFVYKYGDYFYSFEGLRAYKEKFKPEWEPKFLAYNSWMSLPNVLIEIAILISNKKNRKI